MSPDGFRRGSGPDANIDFGVGVALRGDLPHRLLGRLRLGWLLVREPWVFAAGATAELGGIGDPALGLELDAVDFWGGWGLSAGSAVDLDGHLRTHVAVGFSLLAAEWDHAFGPRDERADALYFKLRIPIGVLVFFL